MSPNQSHRIEHGDPADIMRTNRAFAYYARVGGWKWGEIASRLGLRDTQYGTAAVVFARRYAQRHGLPWPVST